MHGLSEISLHDSEEGLFHFDCHVVATGDSEHHCTAAHHHVVMAHSHGHECWTDNLAQAENISSMAPHPEFPVVIVGSDDWDEGGVNEKVFPVPFPNLLLESTVGRDAKSLANWLFRESVATDPHEHAPEVIVSQMFLSAATSSRIWHATAAMQEGRRVFPLTGNWSAFVPVALELVSPTPASDAPTFGAGEIWSSIVHMVQVAFKVSVPDELVISDQMDGILVEARTMLWGFIE